MTDEECAEKDRVGLAALAAWDEAHRDVIVYEGGPLGPTKRTSAEGGVTDVVNLLTGFMVVRSIAFSEATIFICRQPKAPAPSRSRVRWCGPGGQAVQVLVDLGLSYLQPLPAR